MNSDAQRHRELGEFLKACRRRLARDDLGLPPVRGSGEGLRREEVAVLSGVSVTWYMWLEQGRKTQPSRNVLDALARTLRMSVAQHSYVLSLAGYSGPPPPADRVPWTAPAQVLRLLGMLGGLPAYVIAPDWQILCWTSAFERLYPTVAAVPEADRNLLWLMFTDRLVRELCSDWGLVSRCLLAEFRVEAGPCLFEPPISHLVERLIRASPVFRAAWEEHDVAGVAPSERLIHHRVGDLHLERHRLRFSDPADLHMVIFTPAQSATLARLQDLPEPRAGLLDGLLRGR
jgi:transcriptional regulator with XRE-family HTH domain